MNTVYRFITVISVFSLLTISCGIQKKVAESGPDAFAYQINKPEDLNAFFRYGNGDIIVSGHRGGNALGWPENCLETFDKIVDTMTTFFEIDPRLTKDSVIVLLHDPTLQRTTTGTGKLNDYTYAQIQKLFLKDRWGNVTPYKVPKVEDVINWSKGKVILNFDLKDVPREMLVPLVKSCKSANCIYTVHTPEDARTVLAQDPDARMSAWIANVDELKAYEDSGIGMEHIVVAYVVAATMDSDKQMLYDQLHKLGIRCMVSTAPVQDKAATAQERRVLFEATAGGHPDIIESDFPTEFIGMKHIRK
jgi:glycerophosphoryl diester phosphodiesterase